MIQQIDIKKIKLNPDNPRFIKDDKFKKLVKSIREFPDMALVRPIVVNSDMIILGGNMRFQAMKTAGMKTVPVEIVDWTVEKQREFVIKDNASFGSWDWDNLANNFELEELEEWGLDPDSNFEEKKETADIPDDGEIEFSPELLEEHNYIVLYFDNPLDWNVAVEKFGLENVKDLIPRKGQPTGIGRVIEGKKFLT